MADTITNDPNIIILSRTSYDNRVAQHLIDPKTLYFVIEDVTDANKYLSLYVGEAKQTDIISLNELTRFVDKTTIEALQAFILGSGAPAKNLLTTDKIYYWEDTDLNVMRAFMKGKISGEIIPIYTEPVWEPIEPLT